MKDVSERCKRGNNCRNGLRRVKGGRIEVCPVVEQCHAMNRKKRKTRPDAAMVIVIAIWAFVGVMVLTGVFQINAFMFGCAWLSSIIGMIYIAIDKER